MSASIFDRFQVKITLTNDMLATNPCDPNVHDTHILARQRKIIMDKSEVNSAINKYLNQIQISAEQGEEEVNRIIDKLEEMTGVVLSAEERALALSGKLESLKETFKELNTAGTTVFFWDKETDRPCVGVHMIYGFLKAASEAICRTQDKARATILGSISYTQGVINQHLTSNQRFIVADRDIKRTADGGAYYLQRSLRAMTAQGPRVTLAKSEVLEAGTVFEFELRVMKNSPLKESHLRQMFEYGEMKGLGQWRNADYGKFTFELERITTETFIVPGKTKTVTQAAATLN